MDTRLNITDDPRLTAYALGELKGAQRQEIEQLLLVSPEARAEIEAIRRVAGSLTYELAGELPVQGTFVADAAQRRPPMATRTSPSSVWHASKAPATLRGPRVRRRLMMAALATTAAGIAVVLTITSRAGFGPWSQRQAIKNGVATTQTADAGREESPATGQSRATDVQQQLAALVEKFNALMDERRFDEADAIVRQAAQLAPEEPVTRQLVWMNRFRSNIEAGDNARDAKASLFEAAMSSVDASSVPFDDRAPANVAQRISQGGSGYTADPYARSVGDFAAAAQPQAIQGAVVSAPGTRAPTGGSSPAMRGATSCCAPAIAGATRCVTVVPRTSVTNRSVPYTICKPSYVATSPASHATPSSIAASNPAYFQSVDESSEPFDDRVPRTFPKNWDELRSAQNSSVGSESYAPIVENDFLSPLKAPLSTFSVDVDTASYANIRRFLEQGQLPPPDAVRIEEMLNYFSYDYAPPADGKPFAVHVETAACPWNIKHRLARIAIKGKDVPRDKRPPSNLVFLIDVSGSMDEPNKLPLVKASLAMIVESLTENDRIAIVTYAGSVQRVLESTSGEKRSQIMAAISQLAPGGSTNGEGGIQMAYETAVKNFRQGGTNRIILCTDGDFNVGVSGDDELVNLIEEKRKSGVFLSIFGFGMGNLKDAKLEKLADHGNGQYGYIDSRQEARKVFVEGLSGTLVTIAKDVKLQIEFNPAQVGAYRLVGYENRALAAEDFNNDAKDAGDIGAGHCVTALYEIVPAGEFKTAVDPLKYQGLPAKAADKAGSDELFALKLRYKQPDGETSQKIEIACKDRKDASTHPSRDFDWAAGVAAFGMLLRDSKHKGNATFDLALELAQGGKGNDTHGYRTECIELMRKAKGLKVAQKPAEQKPMEPVSGPLGDLIAPPNPLGHAVPAQTAPVVPYSPGSTRSGSP